ncbi:MAG: SUMF1/EgtB/PvdO family nonheme iron enzyme [Candidatus Aminicenantes bacterium]|nr:MAG: SUMF1/EgtB/PvdO family nonheme iron enzyme [Candidatus Aminicenantes bacterium]
MKKLYLSISFIFIISLCYGRFQEDMPDLSNVKIVTTQVAGNIYMLEATGDVAGNIAVSAGPDGILLVDTQFASLSDLILAELSIITKGNIKFIINTHHHIDHTHGNGALGDAPIVIAHANALKRLLHMPHERHPTITFHDRISLFFNGEKIDIVHYPHGHTDSDVVVFFTASNVIHMGDLWNSGISSFPTVDIEAGGSITGMLEHIEELIRIIPIDAKIIPGHYALSGLDDLKSTMKMLQDTIGLVMEKKAAGISLKDIKKEGFPSRYDSWGTAYTNAETWIENIYHGLDQNIPKKIAKIQKKAKQIYKNEKGFWEAEFIDGHVMVHIPGGEFPMGSEDGLSNERPVHQVYLDEYWLGKYPVTVGQFRKFVKETGYVTDAEKGKGSWQFWEGEWIVRMDGNWKNPYFEQEEDHPVVSVSWNDAVAFCRWLSKKTGLDIKLPTAAQWEKGARGMDGRKFPWGNDKPDGTKANYADINYWDKYKDARQPDKNINDGYTETSPVGTYPKGSSPYGLLDMAGNVWEWCHDVYQPDYYTASPKKNPSGPPISGEPDQERVNRGGGSWTDRSGHITPKGGHNLRSAARTGDEQNSSDDHMGFRICIDYFKR